MNRITINVIKSAIAIRKLLDEGMARNALFFRFSVFRHKFWSALSSSEIGPGVRLGKRLALPHALGIVIHEDAVVGDDCMIMQQVTIGATNDQGVPQIGHNVYIGSGAKILGPVIIGDGARIGANAVVLTDVPDGATAVGVPAKIVQSTVVAT